MIVLGGGEKVHELTVVVNETQEGRWKSEKKRCID